MKPSRLRWIFYAVWLVLLLLQARFTPLIDDEAYYWFYSTRLSWGYFDHPPMIAFMIRLGYLLFKNELGVRLLSVVASFLSLLVIEKLLVVKDFKLFATLICTILVAQVGGMIAVPESPYLFFITLFLFQFKKYLYRDSVWNAVLLGLCASAVLYSKYHGAMLFFFMGVFSLRLLKRPTFYMAVLVAVACYLPHILWLVKNDFPSFGYHFGDRNVPGFLWSSIPLYIAGQLILFGPFTSFILFYSLWKYKTIDEFERIIKSGAIGVLGFLLVFCFKGTVEANWTMGLFPVLLIIGHQYLGLNARLKKTFYFTAPFSILLLVLVRIYLVYDFTQGKLLVTDDLHQKKEWARELHALGGGLPVVFTNSYQKASVYSFYSGDTAISLNNLMGRMNQYSISTLEDEWQGRKVLLVGNWSSGFFDSTRVHDKTVYYSFIGHFESFSKVYFTSDSYTLHVHQGTPADLSVHVGMRYTDHIRFAGGETQSTITYHYFNKRELVFQGNTGIKMEPSLMGTELQLHLTPPPEKGIYTLRISVTTGWLPPTFNSKKWKVIVD